MVSTSFYCWVAGRSNKWQTLRSANAVTGSLDGRPLNQSIFRNVFHPEGQLGNTNKRLHLRLYWWLVGRSYKCQPEAQQLNAKCVPSLCYRTMATSAMKHKHSSEATSSSATQRLSLLTHPMIDYTVHNGALLGSTAGRTNPLRKPTPHICNAFLIPCWYERGKNGILQFFKVVKLSCYCCPEFDPFFLLHPSVIYRTLVETVLHTKQSD